MPEWFDSLIVDVRSCDTEGSLQAWAAWNSEVQGSNEEQDPISEGLPEGRREPISFDNTKGDFPCDIALPTVAQSMAVLGPQAHLTIHVTDRSRPTARVSAH